MHMHRMTTSVLSCAALALASTLTAHALSNQTFISNKGSDSGTCSSADPCASITYALTQTSPGGEIVIATSGTYAPATLTQAVNLNAPASVDASISTPATPSGVNAITINTTGNVNLNGITLRGHGTGNDGILVEQVGVLRLNNMTIQNFTSNGIEFKSADSEMSMYNSSLLNNGNDGLVLDASGAKAWVEGSSFDSNNNAGADSGQGKLSIADSNAHYNAIGFYAHGGSVTLYNTRAIFNTTGLEVSAKGRLHFANCLLSDNTTAWNVATGGVLSGSNPGTTLVAPGQTPNTGTLGVATELK
jgi:hypothetical protein